MSEKIQIFARLDKLANDVAKDMLASFITMDS